MNYIDHVCTSHEYVQNVDEKYSLKAVNLVVTGAEMWLGSQIVHEHMSTVGRLCLMSVSLRCE